VLNKIRWLDNIGRTTRSRKNEKLENFLTDLQRLTIVHETDHGGSYYRFASGASSPAAIEDEKPSTAKTGPAPKKTEEKAAKDTKTDTVMDGDKGLSDQHSKGDAHADHKAKQDGSAKPDMADPKASQEAQEEGHRRAGVAMPQQQQQQQQQQHTGNVQDTHQQVPRQAYRQAQAQQNMQQRADHTVLDMDLGRPVSDDDASSGEHTKVDVQ